MCANIQLQVHFQQFNATQQKKKESKRERERERKVVVQAILSGWL